MHIATYHLLNINLFPVLKCLSQVKILEYFISRNENKILLQTNNRK